MKKHVTLIALFCASVSMNCFAQAVYVPNGEMENWNSAGSYEEPVSWSTPNPLTVAFGAIEVYKDTDEYSGTYAARLETKTTILGNVPGAMGTGTLNIGTQTYDGGFPLSNPGVTGFGGFYKYSPTGGDSAFFFALLTKWNVNKRDTVATAVWTSGAQSNYTMFQIPFFTIIPGESADTCLIIVSNTFDVANAHVGTVLWVDQMDLSDLLTVQEIVPQPLQVFPNPSDESVQISLPQELSAGSILISGIDGKNVKEIPAQNASSLNINTSKFAQGLYVAFVKNKEGKEVAAAQFVVKH
jgi:hypothetical protein